MSKPRPAARPAPLPLVLSAKRGMWRLSDERAAEADQQFQTVRSQILERDRYACRGCGFRSKKWQEVHHRDDDHCNNDPANLITVCPLCHMVFHIGRAGLMDEAMLVWMPGMPQATLNTVMRMLAVTQYIENERIRETGQSLIGALHNRSQDAMRIIGTNRPEILAEVLLTLPNRQYQDRERLLNGVRLMWNTRRVSDGEDRAPAMINYWISPQGPFGGLPPSTWVRFFNKVQDSVWEAMSA